MCNCINETLEALKEKVIANLPCSADKSTFTINFKNRIFRFDGKDNNVLLGIEYEYFKTKNDGTKHKNKTKEQTNLEMSYCPMCGEKYA
ncbi:hypothetical protein ERW49_18735 [Aliivibrio finisterrensis]|uniref:Uncharacterized protein n=1 Tax=Aliivibrio finisterrensis TaxID=511998 RepID=A0A4Q5K6C0_9GAMM|nr:hypothetical protein [Aliivibrio finisterrensis]RYU41316.1 hypothetical protein ERW49_18735 [Aliivibrio finisterrensis]